MATSPIPHPMIGTFYYNRWIVFVAACLLQTSAGLNYSFSVFAPALKAIFQLDEVHLGAVATLGFNLGGKTTVLGQGHGTRCMPAWRDHGCPGNCLITG